MPARAKEIPVSTKNRRQELVSILPVFCTPYRGHVFRYGFLCFSHQGVFDLLDEYSSQVVLQLLCDSAFRCKGPSPQGAGHLAAKLAFHSKSCRFCWAPEQILPRVYIAWVKNPVSGKLKTLLLQELQERQTISHFPPYQTGENGILQSVQKSYDFRMRICRTASPGKRRADPPDGRPRRGWGAVLRAHTWRPHSCSTRTAPTGCAC